MTCIEIIDRKIEAIRTKQSWLQRRASSFAAADFCIAVCEELKREIAAKVADWKANRIQYQDIVYEVCNLVDKARGDHGTERCTITNVVERLQEKLNDAERLTRGSDD